MKRFSKTLTGLAALIAASAFAQVEKPPEARATNAPVATPTPAPTQAPPANAAVAPAPAPASTVAAAPATNAAPVKTIRLQFEGIPYSDVIERFSQMAGKPLVSDTNVVGTLSYNDPKPYTYAEALDTLNLMLSMKGVMLVETGNYLRLVPFKQLPAMPLKIMRGTDSSGDVRPGEVVTVVLDVNNIDSKEVADAVTSMLSNAGSVAPLSRGRGLIVTDHLENIERIKTLLRTIDVEGATVNRQMKTYTLLHSSGAILTDLLNRTFGVATAPKRTQYNPNSKALDTLPPDPNDYITAVYDDASRTIVLFGPPERISLAEELINKFESKEGAGGDVRIYYPQTIKPAELANMIRQAVPGIAAPNETAAAAATKARLITDDAQNRLIVAAPIPGQLDEIERLISKIDKGAGGLNNNSNVPVRSETIQLTKVFRPRSSEVTNVATILIQALTRRTPTGGPLRTASVTSDVASQSIVVSGSPNDLQIATDIVTQLETGSSQPMQIRTRFIDVGSAAEAKRIAPLVEELYRNQVGNGLGGAVAHAKIIPDADAGRLIVTASEDHLLRIDELVKQLRSGHDQPQTRRLQIIKLTNVRSETALPGIQNVINDKMSERPYVDLPKPSLIADSVNNRLLVTATESQIREIEQVVKIFDVAPERETMEMRPIHLQARTAAEVIPMVLQILDQTKEPNANPQTTPKLVSDATGRQILAVARPKDFDRIEALVMQFDTTVATSAPRQFRPVELFGHGATELTPLVQQLYTEQLRGQPEPAGGAATLLPDAKANRIMVSGSEKEITRVEAIIRQLDTEEKKTAREETRVIRLKVASAAEIVGLIDKSLNAQQQKVRVLQDARSNSIILSGDSASLDAATQMIQQLDARPNTGPKEMRVIELKAAEAAVVTPMITTMFNELLRDQRGPDYVTQTKIIPDSTANRLVVTGIKEEIEQVASLVQQLDQAPEQAPGARVFKLNNADAVMLAPIVTQAMLRYDSRGQPLKRVTVSADDKANALIVSGSRSDLADVASVIEKLDSESGGGKDRILRIIDVKSEDPDGLAALVLKVFAAQNPGRNTPAMVNITPEAAGKRLIVMASPTVMAQVESVIQTLDSKPEQGARELATVELKNATAAELLPKVTQIYGEQSQGKTIKPATIYPDASGTRFSVYGTKEQAAQIRQIVDTLESQTRAPRETKIFEVGKLAEAQRIIPLATQLYKDQIGNNPQLGAPDAGFMTDNRTGRLIVTARGDQMKIIDDVFSRLLTSAVTNAPARETRTFEVGNASDVQRLLPLVQQLYTEQWKDKSETDPADAQIVADARTGRLIVTGKPAHLEQIGAILKQLGAGAAKPEARDTRIFELTTASAVELATTVRTLYLDQGKSRFGALTPDTLITPDPGGNRLIVVGDTNELNAVEDIVKKLDKVSAQSATARVFKIKSAEPDKVQEILQAALVRYDAYGRPQKRATVSVDGKSRTLIVTGDPKELQGVATIIEQLDSTLGVQTERKMKVVPVKQGRVAEIGSKLRQLYQDQVRNQPELGVGDALILEDAPSNQIMLAGSERQLELIEKILDQIQAAQAALSPRDTKMIEVGEAAEVTRLAPLVQQLYQERWRDKSPTDSPDALIISDVKNARFVVTGRTNHLAEIEAIVTQLRAGKAPTEARETQAFDVGDVTELTRVQPLVQQIYTDRWRGKEATDPADATILADAKNARLLVTARPSHLKEIEAILAKVATPATNAEPRDTRVFELNTASAPELAPTVQSLYRENMRGRSVPIFGQASILPDVSGNRLIVSGSSNELSAVETIINKLDTTTTKSGGARVFKLKNAQADQVAVVLSASLVDFRPGGVRIPRVSVGQDLQNNMLIVSGAPKDIQSAAVIVEQLDGVPAKEPRQMHIVALKNGVASEVGARVRSLYQDQVKGIQGGGVADAVILGDDASGRLIVTASEAHMKLIEDIVSKLQEAGDSSGRQMRVIVLQRNAATSISQMLNQLFAKQVASKDPADRLVVSPSADERTLVVEASAKILEAVQDLVTKLDVATDNNQNVIQTVHLTKGNAGALAQAVSQAVSTHGAPAQRVVVTPVLGANSLLLSGPSAGVEEVTKIIKQLDQESTGGEIEVRIFKLENGSVREIQGVLNSLLETVSRSIARREGDPRSRFTISINERDHSIIVSGVEAHFKVIEKVLPTLDKAPERSDRDVQFVWLKKAKAYDVVSKVESVFSDQPAKDRPVIEADGFNNSITIIARRGDMAQIQDLIQRLDDTAKDMSVQVRLRPLEHVGAEQMARMLQNIYPQMSKGRVRVVEKVSATDTNLPPSATAPPTTTTAPAAEATTATAAANPAPSPNAATNAAPEVVIAVDKESNALVLSGPAQELDHIDRIINDLSYSFYGNEAEFRLFPLKEADPVVVARTLTELLRVEPMQLPPQPGQPRIIQQQAPKITIVSEPRSRSIIVRARPTDFTLVESILKQLDVGGQNAQVDFRLVALTNAPPEKVLPLVQQMVTQLNATRPGEPLTVTLDARGRAILLIARESTLNQVEKMIHSLDAPSAYVEAGVMVINLKKANAGQLVVILQNMLRPGAAGEWTPEARELQEQVRRLKIQNDRGGEVVLDLTKPIKISADPVSGAGGGNRLILTSTADNLKGLAAVVAMMDTPALVEGVETRILTLKNADASTVSQQLSTIFTQGKTLSAGPAGPAQPDSPTGEALSNPISIAVDARSNSLILSAQSETLDLAAKIVGDLDKAIDRFVTEVKLFRLKHASALRMVPLLQSVFNEGPPVPGSEGLSMQVTRLRAMRDTNAVSTTAAPKLRASLVIQADDPSNTLIVAARSDALPLIHEIIEQLDIPAASGLEAVRIYPLNHSDPATVQRILNEMYTGPRAASMRPDDRPVISIDERTNALIIAGNSKAFSIVEALLAQLDQKLPFELRDVKIVPLENTDASLIAANIQRLMDARITQRAALNKGASDTLKVTIIPDQRSNALLVAGSRDSFEMVESLARQLDKAGPALSGKIRLIPLEFADSRVIASTLTTLFTQRYAAARTPDVARQHPIILADPRSNSLLVTANQEDNGAIDDLLKKLDAKTTNPSLELAVVPLKHNDSTRVSTMIEAIFAARSRAQTLPGQTALPSDQIEVQPDGLNNALIISASKENLSYIKELLEKIDVEPTFENGMLQTFTLQFADAQRVATMLRGLIAQGLYHPGRPAGVAATRTPNRDALAISVDPRSNTLLVSASPENLDLVREIIRRVDTKDYTDATNVRVYTLKNARATSLAATLEQFFTARNRAESVAINAPERNIPISVIADDRTNALLITGTKDAFEAADRIIAQLDGESAFARLNFRVFPLKKATATTLQRALQQIVANRPPRAKGEPIEPITIVADAWVNALLVAAASEDMSTIESLIKQLDAEPTDTGIAVHVFPLAKADARRVAQTIQSLFRENTAAGPSAPGGFLPVTVNADERINAIVVSCGEIDAKRIEELVKKLDTEQVARVSEIKVFPLRFARADTLSTILNTALNTKPVPLTEQSPNAQSVLQFITRTTEGKELVTAALKEAVLITPDSRMNSLIVSGPMDYMGLLEQIIERLDQSSPQIAKIKVFALHNADAQNMARLLMQLFRMTAATAGSTPAAQRSIQYTLMRPGLDGVGDDAAATATIGTAEQSALTVTVDLRTNSLLVGGTEHYVALVSQIIENLDGTEANERKTEVVRLKNSQAQEVATAIRTFLDQERTRVTQTLGAAENDNAQRILEREVAVVAEPISNTLLVSASPRYFKDMRELIDELDRPQPQVMIQVVLAEVTLDNEFDLGVQWGYTGKKGDVTYGVGTDFNMPKTLAGGGFSSLITGSDFTFLLRALKEDHRLEVLSRPQIVTADNKPASINIGKRVPLITDSRVTAQNDTVNSFHYEDVGVNMSVTPKISPDGFVKIDISTTNSAISATDTVQINQNATVPIINQRRATTTVTVQSGQTVIIGGLIDTTDERRVKKVPVLADIPGLGVLFRSTTSLRNRKELLILLTPQVLVNGVEMNSPKSIEEITRENLDRSHIRDRKRDELQKEILEPLYPELRDAPPAPGKDNKGSSEGSEKGSDKKKEVIL